MMMYLFQKVPKFCDVRKRCYNQLKILTKMPNHRVIWPKDAYGRQTVKTQIRFLAISDDPAQSAPLIRAA